MTNEQALKISELCLEEITAALHVNPYPRDYTLGIMTGFGNALLLKTKADIRKDAEKGRGLLKSYQLSVGSDAERAAIYWNAKGKFVALQLALTVL